MLRIDADALFRAATATGFKLLAYHLDVETGQIVSRTLRPDEIADAPQGPSVKPLPLMGGDLSAKKNALPFGPPPLEPASAKKPLFDDADRPKKSAFENDFFKRGDKKKPALFGDDGFKRESGSKKLAEIFGGPPTRQKTNPFAAPPPGLPATPPAAPVLSGPSSAGEPSKQPRIPAASDSQHMEWMQAFARESGDPVIRDELLLALKNAKPAAAFERVLRKHQRTGQQWERYYRKNALAYGEAWLSSLGVQWELVEYDLKP